MSLEKKLRDERILSKKVVCDTARLVAFITNWLERAGWKKENFEDFAEIVGIELPIILKEFDERTRSFKCQIESNVEATVNLWSSNSSTKCSEILIMTPYDTRNYVINNCTFQNERPKAMLKQRTLVRDGKTLVCSYYKGSSDRMLEFNDTRRLRVVINGGANGKNDLKIMNNRELVEEYLVGLNDVNSVLEVYMKVKEILGFSREDVSNCSAFTVTYKKIVDNKAKCIGQIMLHYGILYQGVISKKGGILRILDKDNWRYISEMIRISHTKAGYAVSILGSDETVKKINLANILSYVEEEVSKLKELEI